MNSNDFSQENSLFKKILNLLKTAENLAMNPYFFWRQNFIYNRLELGLKIGLCYFVTIILESIYDYFWLPEKFSQSWLITIIIVEIILFICLQLLKNKIRKEYFLVFIFLCLSWSITIIPQIIATIENQVNPNTILIWWLMAFFSQATLIPMRWRLHLISQLGAIGYYFIVNLSLGIDVFPDFPPPVRWCLHIFWLCSISNLSVYLYEKLAKTEFISRQKLQHEKELSESLLLNILPSSIAEKLKQEKQTIADTFSEVTVLFADIVGFTQLASTLTPKELVELLNEIFTLFDQLAEKYNLEKIKTIGDAYLVVAGLPFPRDDHADAIAQMSLAMQNVLKQFNQDHNSSLSIRIGIHTGSVVAGVIGLKKFAYDLWGDTVNTASRMESHGLPGTIQVSETTYYYLKDKYILEKRGQIVIKGKGEMTTYLLLKKRKI